MLKFSALKRRNKAAGFTPLEISKTLPGKAKSLTGFMLLEVILSVFIVTVGVVFVISSFMTSIKAFRASGTYLDMLYLIEEKMWEYEEKAKIEEGSDSGDFEGHKNAAWDIEAKEIEDLPLNETTVGITVKKGGRKRRFKVVTYFYNEE